MFWNADELGLREKFRDARGRLVERLVEDAVADVDDEVAEGVSKLRIDECDVE